MRVEERAHGQPRRVGLFCVEALEQRDRLVGGERVLERAGVVLAEPVRLGADPLREAVVVEQVGLEVLLDVVLDRRAVVVDREQVPVAVVGVEVRVRDVPLALVVGPIAAGPEPVAQRRHGVRRQPEHVVALVVLGDSRGLRDAVQRGVLAGQHRRAARRARGRHRIVMGERHAVLPQPLQAGQMLPPVLGELVGFIGRRVVLLVGQDDQDVRASESCRDNGARAPSAHRPDRMMAGGERGSMVDRVRDCAIGRSWRCSQGGAA